MDTTRVKLLAKENLTEVSQVAMHHTRVVALKVALEAVLAQTLELAAAALPWYLGFEQFQRDGDFVLLSACCRLRISVGRLFEFDPFAQE